MQSQTFSSSKSYSTNKIQSIIETLFQEYGISIYNRLGQEIYIYCLFHDNHHSPAMSINIKTGLWQCFNPSCGKTGNLRQLYHHITGKSLSRHLTIDPIELQREIDKGFNKRKDEELSLESMRVDYSSSEIELLSYLLDRGYSKQTLIDFEVCYSRVKERVVIPVRSVNYELVGYIGRAVSNDQEPKYLYNKGLKRKTILFNLNNAKAYDSVIVCEGSLDCLKIHQAGFKNCVATLGAKVSQEQISLIRKFFDTVIVFSDDDEAGRSMRDDIITGCLGKEILLMQVPEGFKDPGDLTEQQIQQCFQSKIYT
jgi:hypothetical protein